MFIGTLRAAKNSQPGALERRPATPKSETTIQVWVAADNRVSTSRQKFRFEYPAPSNTKGFGGPYLLVVSQTDHTNILDNHHASCNDIG